MSGPRRVLNDLSKIATSAAGLVQGAGKEAENAVRHRLEAILDRMDLVSREEFDAVKAMAQKARQENAELKARLDALEGGGGKDSPAKKKRVAKKTTARKKTGAKKPAAKATARKK